MKKIVKLWLLLAVLFLFAINVDARPSIKPIFKINPIKNAITKSDISKSALIAVSIKEVPSGKTVYELNQSKPMVPASIQKLVTLIPSLETLGYDYEFKTQVYKNSNNGIYIKLGADPYFSNKDLKYIVKVLEENKIYSPKVINFDDSILDANEWGEGWQWDDDLNQSTPKFGAYNMDSNLLTLCICPTIKGAPADISTEVFYPTAFMNNVITGDKNNVKLSRKNYISPDVITADGTIASDMSIKIPVNYPRRYFILRLEDQLRKHKISYYGDFNRLNLPKDSYMLAEVKHPISPAIEQILKNSNNMMSETVFKLAGGKYSGDSGSVDASIEMLNDYYKRQGINTDNIKIVDGSGVSRYNLLTADFVTEVLAKNAKTQNYDQFKSYMAKPGEGTLTDRMLYFKDNLNAKTGTLSDISSIAGYLTAKNGKNYAFCIITSDAKSKSADKKAFEEYVLREAFNSL